MQIELLQPEQLTDDHFAVWRKLQRADSAVDNPSFCPEFMQLAASVRDDVEVAVLRDGAKPVGFFPFHRSPRNVGLPIGAVLTDMHGLVVADGVAWDPMQLIRGCNLAAWEFDHLVASQQPFAPYIQCVEDSPYMDLSDGYDAYIEDLRSRGSSSVKRARSKARKIEREVGPLRLEMVDPDPAAFDAVIRWKRQQIADWNCQDIYSEPWVVEMLRAACQTRTDEFSGMVSSLYAGDELIAVLIGTRCRHVLSSWIPTLNPEFKKYSPGVLLHIELARQAVEEGVRRIDLGRGANQMKTSLRSGGIPLALGAVDRRPINRFIRHGWYKTRDLVYATPLRGLPLRFYRRIRNWSALHSR